MLKFKTSCAVLAYLSSNLLNEVGLALFRYFEVGLYVCAISSSKISRPLSQLLMSSCNAIYRTSDAAENLSRYVFVRNVEPTGKTWN